MNDATPDPQSQAAIAGILGAMALPAVVVLSVVGFFMAGAAGMQIDPTTERIIVGVLGLIALWDIFLLRFMIAPKQTQSNAPTAMFNLAVLTFAFTVSSGVYGLVAALITGEGLLVVPFAVLAVVLWLVMRSYITGLDASRRDEEFPRF